LRTLILRELFGITVGVGEMTGVGVGEELLWLEGEENLKTTKRAINKSIRGIIKMSLGNFEEDDDRDSIS